MPRFRGGLAASMLCVGVAWIELPAAGGQAQGNTASAITHRTAIPSLHTSHNPTLRGSSGLPTACPAVAECLANPNCTRCLDALGPAVTPTHQASVAARNERHFFELIKTTAACYPDATPPPLLGAVLEETRSQPCPGLPLDFVPTACAIGLYSCLLTPHCSGCVGSLLQAQGVVFGVTGAVAEVLGSANCSALLANPLAAQQLFALQTSSCLGLPECSIAKWRCTHSSNCSACLEVLQAGDGPSTRAAARECPGLSEEAIQLDLIVQLCVSDAIGCDYFSERCALNAGCDSCLTAMGNSATGVATAVAAYGTPACAAFRVPRSTTSSWAYHARAACQHQPQGSRCQLSATLCLMNAVCAACLNGTTPPENQKCVQLLGEGGYGVNELCKPCSPTVTLVNRVVLATSIVGGISAAACIVVIALLLGSGAHRRSMRDRIVIGLMMANVAYSIGSAVPLNSLQTAPATCGLLALSFESIRYGRAVWFGGKYAVLAFEAFIVVASLWALVTKTRRFPAGIEAALHFGCCGVGAAAFAGFAVRCATINHAGYNSATERETFSNGFLHIDPSDDFNDDGPGHGASLRFESARSEYDGLVQRMLQVWAGLLGAVVLSWVGFRRRYTLLLRAWKEVLLAAAAAEAEDEWADTRRGAWKAQRAMLALQREAYAAVAAPLELYVIVFMAFGIPATVMATSWCLDHSSAEVSDSVKGLVEGQITYQTCDVWCELVLAFRSLATVLVFFLSRERRSELASAGGLCRGVVACCIPGGKPATRPSSEARPGSVQFELTDRAPSAVGTSKNSAVPGIVPQSTSPSETDGTVDEKAWQIPYADITLESRLAEGAFGAVWRGTLTGRGVVAIKVLKGTAVDAEGDALDPHAEEDFRKECDVLRRLRHPHLLSFYGYGVTPAGSGFLVTELMPRGSLRAVLRDKTETLPWATRLTIAAELASGMEHLHQIPIVHRDLKSANALLDADFTAKVCDFGTGRHFRPAPPTVLFSPFTGVSRPGPASGGAAAVAQASSASAIAATLSVGVMDPNGTMTKAVGTLLWMAPEVFRGDRDYGRSVDVYSFGIILWELGHPGQTPWDDLGDSLKYAELIAALNEALRTGRRPNIADSLARDHPNYTRILRQCWAGDATERPSFSQVVLALRACVNSAVPHRPQDGDGRNENNVVETSLTQPLLAAPW